MNAKCFLTGSGRVKKVWKNTQRTVTLTQCPRCNPACVSSASPGCISWNVTYTNNSEEEYVCPVGLVGTAAISFSPAVAARRMERGRWPIYRLDSNARNQTVPRPRSLESKTRARTSKLVRDSAWDASCTR